MKAFARALDNYLIDVHSARYSEAKQQQHQAGNNPGCDFTTVKNRERNEAGDAAEYQIGDISRVGAGGRALQLLAVVVFLVHRRVDRTI